MVEPGEAAPPFTCKHCDGPVKRNKAAAPPAPEAE